MLIPIFVILKLIDPTTVCTEIYPSVEVDVPHGSAQTRIAQLDGAHLTLVGEVGTMAIYDAGNICRSGST